MEFLPILPASWLSWDTGSAAPAERTEASPRCRLTTRDQLALTCAQEEPMKIALSFLLAAARFSIFRGQAYMNLTFRSIEVDSRLIPVQMSIIAIEQPRGQAEGQRRKDLKVDEGQVVQEKHDIKGDIVGATIGTGGGTLIGAVFSHVARGFGLGLAGSAAYIVARKGKDLELPAQTGMLVRMDNTVTVPVTSASNASLANGNR